VIHIPLFGARRVPWVCATAKFESGIACLAAVVGYFFGKYTIADIRTFNIQGKWDGDAETPQHLRDLAERIGLAARMVQVSSNDLGSLRRPAILGWGVDKFVVLDSISRRGIVVMDPTANSYVFVPWNEVSATFTGVSLELEPTVGWNQRAGQLRKFSLRTVIGPLSRWRVDLFHIIWLSLLLELLVLIAPLQLQLSIDHAVKAPDGKLAWVLGIGFTFLALIQASISLIRAWTATVFGTRVGHDLMDRFVRALHAKSPRFFIKHHTADILSRGRSVYTIQTLVTAQMVQALLDGFMSMVMIAAMFVMMPLLAVIVALFSVVSIAVSMGLRNASINNSRAALRIASETDALFLENTRAVKAIRLFGKETVRTSIWRNKFIELTNLHLIDSKLTMLSSQAVQVAGTLGNVVLISVGTHLAIEGSISLGTMIMFVVMRAFFVERLNRWIAYMADLRRVSTHAERIEGVLLEEGSTTNQRAGSLPFVIGPEKGVRIEVLDVWFRYDDESPWILKGLNLTVEPGESVAITGISGSGKTTLLNVMLGLLEPSRGEVLINGRRLSTIASADYARLIGVVMQDDSLFHATVADNISFFDAPTNMTRVVTAAEKANISSDILAMPMQYFTILSEAAIDISGGQRQRLLIARAIYHEPRILFLDEATSHLDAVSEGHVSRAVRDMRMTRVLVAHRKETIATADRVVVLNKSGGNIIDDSHKPGELPGHADAV